MRSVQVSSFENGDTSFEISTATSFRNALSCAIAMSQGLMFFARLMAVRGVKVPAEFVS